MSNLDDVLKAIAAKSGCGVFVSRSGGGRELSIWIAATLKKHDYIPVLQDAHFKQAVFMLAMDQTRATAARVPTRA